MRKELQLLFILSLLVLGTFLPATAKSTPAVIQGLVRAATEDENGNVLSVEIVVTEGEQEEPYLVSSTGKGPELLLYIGQYVLAGGVVSEDELGWKTIEVQHYDLTSKYPDR